MNKQEYIEGVVEEFKEMYGDDFEGGFRDKLADYLSKALSDVWDKGQRYGFEYSDSYLEEERQGARLQTIKEIREKIEYATGELKTSETDKILQILTEME